MAKSETALPVGFESAQGFAFCEAPKTAYQALKDAGSSAKYPQRVVTLAALAIAGYCRFIGNGKTLVAGTGNPSPDLFVQLASKTPLAYHTGEGRIDSKGLTVEGLNFFNAALAGEAPGGWNADAASVKAVFKAMREGGPVTIAWQGGKVTIDCNHLVTGTRKIKAGK